jgi:hypothetical protein
MQRSCHRSDDDDPTGPTRKDQADVTFVPSASGRDEADQRRGAMAGLLLQGKVAIVTGGGQGIGRLHAT